MWNVQTVHKYTQNKQRLDTGEKVLPGLPPWPSETSCHSHWARRGQEAFCTFLARSPESDELRLRDPGSKKFHEHFQYSVRKNRTNRLTGSMLLCTTGRELWQDKPWMPHYNCSQHPEHPVVSGWEHHCTRTTSAFTWSWYPYQTKGNHRRDPVWRRGSHQEGRNDRTKRHPR